MLALALCAGCAGQGSFLATADSDPDVVPPEGENGKAADTGTLKRSSGELARQQQEEKTQPTLFTGTDRMIDMPPDREPVKVYGEDVSLNFEEAPLVEVVHTIMGEILDLDYIVEHPINGEVTLRTRNPVPRDQLLPILESLLQSNKALMVRDGGGRFIVSASPQMSKLRPSVSGPNSKGAGYTTIVVPLQYLGANSMAEILAPVAEESAFVRVDAVRNLLMLAGTRAQLDGWLEIIETFDVDVLKGMSVGIFPLEHTSVEEIDTALATILGREGAGQGNNVPGPGVGNLVKIVPVERLNSIMVITPRSHYLERVEKWIARLDKSPDSAFEPRLYVYPVQNSSALRLADLVGGIFTGAGGGSRRAASGRGVAPGMQPETVSGGGNTGGTGRQRTGGTGTGFQMGDTRIMADEENNSLLIYATRTEYEKIEAALKKLDVLATQVIIEASILEVTLTDELQYGLEWTFNESINNNNDGVGTLINSGSAISAQAPGFSYSVTNPSGDIKAVLNALANRSLINVISTPSVMVLDNSTAEIHVGDQVPVRGTSTVTDGGNTIQSIEFRDTGVQLSVTPTVNAGGMVTMDIQQSVTDVGQVDAATGQRSFLEREISSRVAVRSQESVVLGGLIRENASKGSSGIPVLHRIPVIGALFGAKDISDTRTELLVIITPRVLFNESDLQSVSREMRARMRGFDLLDVSESSLLQEVEADAEKGTAEVNE